MGVVDPKWSDVRIQTQQKKPGRVNRPREVDDEYARKKFNHVLDDKDGKETKDVDEKDELPTAMSLVTPATKRKKISDLPDEINPDSGRDNPTLSKMPPSPFDISALAKTETQTSSLESKKQLEEMFKMLVDRVVEMKLDGRTETTVVLQHPPLFAGAKLTLTTFDTAKGEFNIMFSELNNQAKTLLDLSINRETLLNQLHEKGYAVHILIATTGVEETPVARLDAERAHKEPQKERQGREKEEPEEESA